MHYTYVVYDDKNHAIERFGGPCRLAKWNEMPRGWGIERFLGNVSQGMVTMEDVRAHAREVKEVDHGRTDPQPNQMEF